MILGQRETWTMMRNVQILIILTPANEKDTKSASDTTIITVRNLRDIMLKNQSESTSGISMNITIVGTIIILLVLHSQILLLLLFLRKHALPLHPRCRNLLLHCLVERQESLLKIRFIVCLHLFLCRLLQHILSQLLLPLKL